MRILEYRRTLSFRSGILSRDCTLALRNGELIRISFERFLSREHKHIAALEIRVTPLTGNGTIRFSSSIDAGVRNLKMRHWGEAEFIGGSIHGYHGLKVRTLHTGVVEDATAGVEGALRAGMRVWAVGSAAQHPRATARSGELAKILADEILRVGGEA